MPHNQALIYKVCVYEDSYSDRITIVGNYRSYDKAKKVLSDYLKTHSHVSRAYVEKSSSFKNDKRNMWDF